MQIEPLDDPFEVHSIITNPKLYKMTYGQGCLVEEFEVDKTCSYYGVIIGKELGGVFQLKEFNKITYDAHIYLLPRYQDGNLSIKAVKAFNEYIKEFTDIYSIFTSVPLECTHVHKFLSKTDYKITGKLTNSIIFNSRLQDLILYQREMREV